MREHTPESSTAGADLEPTLLRDEIVHRYEDSEMLFLDPPALDTAIVGVVYRVNVGHLVVYDRRKLLQAFVADGMSDEEAEEWLSFNVEGAWVGGRTPLILEPVEDSSLPPAQALR